MNPAQRLVHLRRPVRARRVGAMLLPIFCLTLAAAAAGAGAEEETDGGERSAASRIPAAAADPVRPLAVVDRDDIELSGMKSVEDLVLRRFGYNRFGLYRPFVLGTGGAAFLVNGRPIADSIIDLDTLPISAVERIEILNGTAAALHGGQAVAGAINVVLRRGHEGTEVRIGGDRPAEAGGDAEHASALWGGRLGRGHLTIGADVIRRQEVRDADRDFSRASWTPGGSFSGTTGVSASGNTLNFTIGGPGGSESGRYGILGECSEDVYTGPLTLPGPLGEVCGFAYADSKWLDGFGRRERGAVYLAAGHPLGGGADVHVDARAAQGESDFRYAPAVGDFAYTLPDDVEARLAREHGTTTADIRDNAVLLHRFVGHGNRDWRTGLEEYDIAVGVRGRFGNGVGHDAVLRLYRYDSLTKGGTFVSRPLIEEAVASGRYDAENPLDPDLNEYPEHWDAVRETSVRLRRETVTDHHAARVVFDGSAFALPAGNVRWAAGTELAREDYRNVREHRDRSGNFVATADALGSGGGSVAGERRRWSAFAEAALPLLDAWDLSLAGRRDDHDDAGATFSWRVASRFRPSDALAFRTSWSRSGRAPHLTDLHERDSVIFPTVYDPRDEGCSPCQKPYEIAGNPDLDPDDAMSMSTGAAVDLGPLSLSLDWFRIEISGAPGALSAQSILDLDAEGRSLPPGVSITRKGQFLEHVRSEKLNITDQEVTGLDLRAGSGWKAGGADIALDARWMHVTRRETRVNGQLEPEAFPRHRLHASLRAGEGSLTALWSLHAVSGYSNRRRTGRYEGWAGHDVALRWSDAFGLDGLGLTAGVMNIGDREPPSDSANPDAQDVRLDSGLGRTLFLSARMSFGP